VPIIIKSKREGFRRCGLAHSKEPVTHDDGRFSEEELARLRAEPMLTVEIVPAEDKPDMTVAQLKEALEAKEIEVPASAKKADLVKLYQEAGEAEVSQAGGE